MRFRILIPMLCCVSFAASAAKAQSLPSAPLFPLSPTEPRECQAFANEVQKYETELTRQHEECLRAGKEDRPNQPPDSLICSRSGCQALHDLLYSTWDFNGVKVLHQRVDACYAQVNEYQGREAREKREAEERERADSEQAARDQESANEARKKREEEQRKPDRTRISPTPTPRSPANNPAVLPPSQPTGQPYSVDSMKVPDTPQTQQARQAEKEREQKELSEQALNEMTDPFGKSSGGGSSKADPSSSDGMVDPFGKPNEGAATKDAADPALADPFSADSRERQEAISDRGIAVDKAKDIGLDTVQGALKDAKKQLQENLDKARSELGPADFARYEKQVENVTNFLDGLRHTITTVGYAQDVNKWIDDPKNGWGPLAHDLGKDGFSYVLKRIAPPLSKVYEGPIGWAGSILLESSSTQTPAQDFDPMTVLNAPSQYSFDQRVAALQQIYVSEGKHPEVWNESKCRWLYNLTLQVYNSPDNPNIRLTPLNDPNIHLTPQ
jgi:hypothetical protein